MNLHELSGWIRDVNQSNGFDSPTWNNLPIKLMLVVTELSEARDAVFGTGEDPLAEELADTSIRLIDILSAVWSDGWSCQADESKRRHPSMAFQPIETLLWRPLRYVCLAVEAWRHENSEDARIAIELALRETLELAGALNFDMDVEIAKKVRRNMERGRLHGKARVDG